MWYGNFIIRDCGVLSCSQYFGLVWSDFLIQPFVDEIICLSFFCYIGYIGLFRYGILTWPLLSMPLLQIQLILIYCSFIGVAQEMIPAMIVADMVIAMTEMTAMIVTTVEDMVGTIVMIAMIAMIEGIAVLQDVVVVEIVVEEALVTIAMTLDALVMHVAAEMNLAVAHVVTPVIEGMITELVKIVSVHVHLVTALDAAKVEVAQPDVKKATEELQNLLGLDEMILKNLVAIQLLHAIKDLIVRDL